MKEPQLQIPVWTSRWSSLTIKVVWTKMGTNLVTKVLSKEGLMSGLATLPGEKPPSHWVNVGNMKPKPSSEHIAIPHTLGKEWSLLDRCPSPQSHHAHPTHRHTFSFPSTLHSLPPDIWSPSSPFEPNSFLINLISHFLTTKPNSRFGPSLELNYVPSEHMMKSWSLVSQHVT